MAGAWLCQRDEEVGIGCVFWCPVSAIQPTEKRSVSIAPPSDLGQGDSEYAPAGPFRQVDYLGRPAVCQRRGRGAWDVVVAEVIGNQCRRNPSVVRCYAPMSRLGPCIAQACRVPVASDGVAGAKRGVVVGGKPSFDYATNRRGCRLASRLAGPA